jgi:hypothetical protein
LTKHWRSIPCRSGPTRSRGCERFGACCSPAAHWRSRLRAIPDNRGQA